MNYLNLIFSLFFQNYLIYAAGFNITYFHEPYKSIQKYSSSVDYCKLTCKLGNHIEKHTICKRKNHCGTLRSCIEIPSDRKFREEMIRLHNEYRNLIANGTETRGFNTGATNMNAISYDPELEKIARCWANTCNTLEHDKCRRTRRFSAGQNIFWASGMNENTLSTSAIKSFFNEIDSMADSGWIKGFPQNTNGKIIGHYTHS